MALAEILSRPVALALTYQFPIQPMSIIYLTRLTGNFESEAGVGQAVPRSNAWF